METQYYWLLLFQIFILIITSQLDKLLHNLVFDLKLVILFCMLMLVGVSYELLLRRIWDEKLMKNKVRNKKIFRKNFLNLCLPLR